MFKQTFNSKDSNISPRKPTWIALKGGCCWICRQTAFISDCTSYPSTWLICWFVCREVKNLPNIYCQKDLGYGQLKHAEYVSNKEDPMASTKPTQPPRRTRNYYTKESSVPVNLVLQRRGRFSEKMMIVGAMTGRGVLLLMIVPHNMILNLAHCMANVLKPLLEDGVGKIYGEGASKVYEHHEAARAHTAR
ncbi:unnamed protein product [Allacma fusca]|uniref:Uncharacterized protein n=1 Tax=Allacma fusca TaxID=39272 RepID=A0A8J2J6N9_9HEXA|nr:unnamed protein product [Allacma fusca]